MKRNYRKLLAAGILGLACVAGIIYVKKEAELQEENPDENPATNEKQASDEGMISSGQSDFEEEPIPEDRVSLEELEKTQEPQKAETFEWNTVEQLSAGSIVDTSLLTEIEINSLFYSQEITEVVFERINGISYQENDSIGREDLRYLRVLHMGFDGQTHIGELIVNRQIAEDILSIMKTLYENQYPIEKMVLIDEYGGDDNSSMGDNNSSAFNYRVIAGTTRMSKHSLGMAVDINPMYNPYIRPGEDGETIVEPAGSEAYTDRQADIPYKIDENDLCYQLFAEHGFTWGGSWNTVKDYQHFQKTME